MEYNSQPAAHNDINDILQEEASTTSFIYATQGQRFLNWLIDNLLIRFTLTYITSMGVGYMLGMLAPQFMVGLIGDGSMNFSLFAISMLIAYFNYIIYYTLCEAMFKGLTLGKIITGTRAVRNDGQELTFRNALLRSLSRCVPFEVFSGFSTLTWHDQWTDTMVVKTR